MENDKDFDNIGGQNPRITTGLLLLVIGGLLLAYKMGAPIPGWLFTWPVILIVIGLFVGIKSKFQNPGSFIMILIGAVFLADRSIPGIDFRNYLVPVILMGIGLIFILRPKNKEYGNRRFKNFKNDAPDINSALISSEDSSSYPKTEFEDDKGEYINIQAILGGVKRNVQSKNFKGGQILSFMGGSEVNFMQSDLQQPVILEVHNVFGGTKLIIPSNWDIQNNVSAVLGGVEDKRVFNNSVPDSNKRITLQGTCLFGGLEVTNY